MTGAETARPGLMLQARGLVLDAPARSGAVRILDVDRLRCPAGGRVALVGPSGSGKTSLLHCLAGIARPDAGAILWGTTELSGLGARALDGWRRRHLGFVFQDAHLVPELDALDNVLLPARFAGWRVPAATRARAAMLLERVGLGDQARRRAGALSRGEQGRVAVARALLGRPSLILADEPTASLDAAGGVAIADLLLAAARESGATLLVATHDPVLASRLDLVWTLRAGRLVEPGRALAA